MRGIDRFGSLLRDLDGRYAYVDLTQLTAPVIPTPFTSGELYHSEDSSGIASWSAFTCAYSFCDSLIRLEEVLSRPGLHIVLFCYYRTDEPSPIYRLAHYSYPPESPEARHPVLKPRPFAEWVDRSVDLAMFPHACPSCGAPAYVGLRTVECSGGGCQFVGRR